MISRTVPLGHVSAPSLAEVLADSITGDHQIRLKTKAAPDLLERFCRIAEAPDTAGAVVAFASRWGVLGLCEHGLPYRHSDIYRLGHRPRRLDVIGSFALDSNNLAVDVSDSDRPCRSGGAESFQDWKELALRFDSLLRIGLDLNRSKLSEHVVWELAETDPDFPPWDESLIPSNIDDARKKYMDLIERLIQISQLQPSFRWSGGVWNIFFSSEAYAYSNVPAILTAQLMLRVSSAKAQIKCSECPRWFIPRRNQRKYCDDCGIRAAWRVAQRKRKQKE